MIKSLSHDIRMFFDKKRKVIEAVKSYYNGKTGRFPHSLTDIKETKSWLMTSGHISQKEMLIERLNILEIIVAKESYP